MRAVWLATQKFCLVAACLCVRIEEHVTRGDAALWGYSVCSRMSWDLSVYGFTVYPSVTVSAPVNLPSIILYLSTRNSEMVLGTCLGGKARD